MPLPGLFCFDIWWCRELFPCGNGLGQLSGRLSLLEVLGHLDSFPLYSAGCNLPTLYHFASPAPQFDAIVFVLLYKCENPLLLWTCSGHQASLLWCTINKILTNLLVSLFAGIPLVGIISLILKLSDLFCGYHQWGEGIKHFILVGLTSQLFLYSMGQLLGCIWVLWLWTLSPTV
jgi:hypothetical protein